VLTLQNFINIHTTDPEMYKEKRKMKRINLHDVKLTDVKISLSKQSTTCTRSTVVMGVRLEGVELWE
jgi:hypothetical protein